MIFTTVALSSATRAGIVASNSVSRLLRTAILFRVANARLASRFVISQCYAEFAWLKGERLLHLFFHSTAIERHLSEMASSSSVGSPPLLRNVCHDVAPDADRQRQRYLRFLDISAFSPGQVRGPRFPQFVNANRRDHFGHHWKHRRIGPRNLRFAAR